MLTEAIDNLNSKRIGVAGDLVADVYVSGQSDHISREAPILVVNYEQEWLYPGGAACVATNIAALGSTAHIVGLVADDKWGRGLLSELARIDAPGSVVADKVVIAPDGATMTKTRFLAGARQTSRQQVFRLDRGHGASPAVQWREQVLESARAIDKEVDAWVVCDYGHGAIDDAMRQFIREVALHKPVIVDSWKDVHHFEGMAFIKMNERGAESAASALGIRFEHGDELAHALQSHLNVRGVLVTLGKAGMVLSVDGAVTRIPAVRTEQTVDLTGAGEAVSATLAVALAGGIDPTSSAWLADHAGSIVVMKDGPAAATRDEIRSSIEQDANRP